MLGPAARARHWPEHSHEHSGRERVVHALQPERAPLRRCWLIDFFRMVRLRWAVLFFSMCIANHVAVYGTLEQ